MKTHDFWYDLPEELIAQTPLQQRDASRLMVLNKQTGEIAHKHFYDIVNYLRPGDCLVMNDSRVLPARLLGHRPTGGAVEVLLLRDLGDKCWECLCKPGRKMQPGSEVIFGDGELTATVREVREDGNRVVEFHYEGIFLEVLERLGKMPLPPYIKAELKDQERYQTVYSREVARLRPTHDFQIGMLVDTVDGYRGGLYGFFSAHAANTFSVALFMSLLMRSGLLSSLLVAWSLTNCWTRLYLGVHYPIDILCGLLWGGVVGTGMYFLYRYADRRFCCSESDYVSSKYTSSGYKYSDLYVIALVLAVTLIYCIFRSLILA